MNPDHELCPYNPAGTECMNPDTCMCKQIHKAIPSGLNNTAEERWCDAVDDETAQHAATHIIEKERKSSNASKTTCSIRLTNQEARPHNEWTEKQIMAMAFVVEFPFGNTSFRTPRHIPTDDLIEWTRHLAYLCYKLDNETGDLKHVFQANPVFVLYIRNRAHRHAINNDLKFYLRRTAKKLKKKFPQWHDGITNAEFKKWDKGERLAFSNFVTSNLECKPGDPADLQKFKRTITSCTLSHGIQR